MSPSTRLLVMLALLLAPAVAPAQVSVPDYAGLGGEAPVPPNQKVGRFTWRLNDDPLFLGDKIGHEEVLMTALVRGLLGTLHFRPGLLAVVAAEDGGYDVHELKGADSEATFRGVTALGWDNMGFFPKGITREKKLRDAHPRLRALVISKPGEWKGVHLARPVLDELYFHRRAVWDLRPYVHFWPDTLAKDPTENWGAKRFAALKQALRIDPGAGRRILWDTGYIQLFEAMAPLVLDAYEAAGDEEGLLETLAGVRRETRLVTKLRRHVLERRLEAGDLPGAARLAERSRPPAPTEEEPEIEITRGTHLYELRDRRQREEVGLMASVARAAVEAGDADAAYRYLTSLPDEWGSQSHHEYLGRIEYAPEDVQRDLGARRAATALLLEQGRFRQAWRITAELDQLRRAVAGVAIQESVDTARALLDDPLHAAYMPLHEEERAALEYDLELLELAGSRTDS